VTASASSSSVASPPELLRVDLAAAGLLPPLVTALVDGRDRELLDPLRLLPAGELPARPRTAPPPDATRQASARGELARALEVSNRAYGHGGAERLARLLADPAACVVVAGQQPGLFGGPLYTFSKMLAAARWAAELEAAGEAAVAVFWVATEDHDYSEVSSATVFTAEGARTFDLGPDPEPLVPVGMRTLSPAVTAVLRGIAEAVPGELYAEWVSTLERWYRPDARFGEAFCRIMAHLLGPRCPLLIDAMHPALKAAQRPWLTRLVERRRQVEEALGARSAAIEARGFEPRVAAQPGASPLFLLHQGRRRRIEWREPGATENDAAGDAGDIGFALRGSPGGGGSVAELLRTISENPAVVSPGVLARPAVQDAVLGSTLQVLGPGELTYMAQAAAIYPVLGVSAPWAALRPQTLVLESHQAAKLEEEGLSLADLLGDRARLDRILAAREGGGDFVAPVRRRVEEALEELRAPAAAADVSLERPLEKTRDQVLRALDLFAGKAVDAAARRNEVRSGRVELLREICLPQGRPQERVISTSHFQGKYGSRFAASFWEQMSLDPTLLQVISP
jgi:bacillithiol biosynthesis cysteine-adding enzyme BshC